MTTTAIGETSPSATVSAVIPPERTRVSFVPAGSGRQRLDGAWWPRSRDLRTELPGLVAALDGRFGRIGHVTVNNSTWPEIPRRVAVAGRVLHVGWFAAEQDPDEVCVMSRPAGRWDLLVVPPEFASAAASRLMEAASAADNTLTAGALMASARRDMPSAA